MVHAPRRARLERPPERGRFSSGERHDRGAFTRNGPRRRDGVDLQSFEKVKVTDPSGKMTAYVRTTVGAVVATMVLTTAAEAQTAPVVAATQAATPVWVTPLITALAGLLGAVIGGHFATRNAKAGFVQKTNELEVASIDRRLGDFIGPFEQLSEENLKLAQELKRRQGDTTFRTLTALLDPQWKASLTPGDRALLDALIENGIALRTMILNNGGAVSPAIRPYTVAASMHFRMLALAYAGSLDPDPDRYASYVFPRQLDGVLALERTRLEARRELLRSSPETSHPPMGDLSIPPDLFMTDTRTP